MPLVRISLAKGKPEAYRRKVGDAVHRALVETIDVPPLERFQLLTEHVWINLVEVARENWSFGNGVASYAPEARMPAPLDRSAHVQGRAA